MFISYTPKREIVGGAGEIEAGMSPVTPSTTAKGWQKSSLGGTNVETALHRLEETVTIDAGPVSATEEAKWREFEHSTAAGETFDLDLYGTQASPDNVRTVRMKFGTFRRRNFGPAYHYYTFTVLL